ncbi:hypothetical protein Lser_V15G19578 [Lactuca serriola]
MSMTSPINPVFHNTNISNDVEEVNFGIPCLICNFWRSSGLAMTLGKSLVKVLMLATNTGVYYFCNGTEESRLAVVRKEREQTKSWGSIVTTQIQQLENFYPAKHEHHKFELKRNPFLLQMIGNLVEEELEKSRLAAKLNGYAAELSPPRIQTRIDGKLNEIIRKGWPILTQV